MEAAPTVDRTNPLNRFQLITMGYFEGRNKAFIKDLLKNESKLLAIGEVIGDCKLMDIIPEEQSVRLKPTEGPEFSIKRNRQAR